jgi:excisionase family DNA binding protein
MIPEARRRPTLTADEAFEHLGIDRTTGYRAIRDGTFPLPIVRVGRLIRIPTAALRRLLQVDEPGRSADVELSLRDRESP